MNNAYQNSEELLRDELINKILVVSAAVAVPAIISAQFRAFTIGWAFRDILQLFAVGSALILVLFRHHLKASKKAFFIIILYSFGGITGVYTLGMLGGAIFLVPTAVVVMAIFYSKRTTLIYIEFSFLLCGIIAIGFCTGIVKLKYSADLLMTSYLHWFAYIVCIVFFFAVTYVTIHNYRGTMRALIKEIGQHRDELVKTNEELIAASKNVKLLTGLLPICSFCKKIRNDKGYWSQIELYIKEHSDAEFTHCLCPDCMKLRYPEESQDVTSEDNI